MDLSTLDKRYELVKDMIDKAFEFQDEVSELEDDNDWAGVAVTLDNLAAIEGMICEEETFLNAFEEMQAVRMSDRDDKETYLSILYLDGLVEFSRTILLPRLQKALDTLNDWGFRTEGGKKFQEDFSVKLDALIKEYYSLYEGV
ncbi:MAG: hypothetical protein IKT98_03465 [Selenomonadaceae bacterium]|nr:hypothetical protein [Selenomonadaceae bacterium]